jgi:midasin
MADLLQNCEALIELNSTSTRMVSLAEKCRDAVLQLQEEVRTEFVVAEGNAGQQQSPVLASRLKLLQKYTQVLYQNVHEHVRVVWDSQADDGQKEQARRESFDRSTIITASDQHHLEPGTKGGEKSGTESEQPELSVAEQDSFCERLVEALNQKEVLVKIVDLAESIACMQGVEANALLSENDLFCLTTCAQVIDRIKGLLAYILDAQASYLVSLCKFSYLTQRIFLYLIYQGFCGKDEKEDEQEQEQRKKDDQFMDGLGMGDGRGDNNVSNEIEHEEQLEGLKNYESEEEQPQPKPEEQKKNEDEEEKKNDFEMENDFEGELEDVEQEEKPDDEDKKSEKSDDLDDALDKVDDMLDNQLWNQNMADMEQKEDEAGENEEEQEKDEIDLGDRELNDDNLIEDKEKELTAGDHDKQDDKKEEKKEDKKSPEDKQAEEEKAERGSDEDQSEGQDDENMESVSN